MTETWTKDTHLCTICDALIEVTRKGEFGNIWHCGGECVLLSVEDATIQPITTKEEKMETTENVVPDTYNPNLLVTYKVIRGYSDAEYATDKVASIEWDLHNARQAQKTNAILQDKINNAKDIIAEAYPDSQDQDTLRSIAEALGIELTRTVEWTATIEVSGSIELDLLEDYELEDEITDNLYVDSQSGRIEIGDIEVCHVREA